jgi:hypothetical protein
MVRRSGYVERPGHALRWHLPDDLKGSNSFLTDRIEV